MISSKHIGFLILLCTLFLGLILTSDYKNILTEILIDTYDYPETLSEELIKPILETIHVEDIELELVELIRELPSDRYYKSENGAKAAHYLHDYLKELMTGSALEFELSKFEHSWVQPSLILKVQGKSKKSIIIGCHIDSINFKFYQHAPGVDDNLSGIVTVIQTIKQLIKLVKTSNVELVNSVEFQFYAAEEMGVIGSTQVFKQYRDNNIEIIGMLQQDMTGYTKASIDSGKGEHFGLIVDYASTSLMEFIKRIVSSYTSIPIINTECGKVCSDHVSALMFQYPSVYVLESEIALGNPFIHTEEDTIDKIDFKHMLEHVKLTTAFTMELITQKVERSSLLTTDTVKFRYIDFVILFAMHQTKRFVYTVLVFAALVATVYITILDARKTADADTTTTINDDNTKSGSGRDSGTAPRGVRSGRDRSKRSD